MKISTAARNAACDAIVDLVDAGTPPGYLQIRTGSAPANPAAANTGTLLVTITLANPAFGSAATGVATLAGVSPATAVADGTAEHFRLFNNADTCILQGTCGTSGELVIDDAAIVDGGTVTVSSLTISVPEQ